MPILSKMGLKFGDLGSTPLPPPPQKKNSTWVPTPGSTLLFLNNAVTKSNVQIQYSLQQIDFSTNINYSSCYMSTATRRSYLHCKPIQLLCMKITVESKNTYTSICNRQNCIISLLTQYILFLMCLRFKAVKLTRSAKKVCCTEKSLWAQKERKVSCTR